MPPPVTREHKPELSHLVRERMRVLGLESSQVCQATGWTRQTVSALRSGYPPTGSMAHFSALAAVLQITLDELATAWEGSVSHTDPVTNDNPNAPKERGYVRSTRGGDQGLSEDEASHTLELGTGADPGPSTVKHPRPPHPAPTPVIGETNGDRSSLFRNVLRLSRRVVWTSAEAAREAVPLVRARRRREAQDDAGDLPT